jgi:hypothetical protein
MEREYEIFECLPDGGILWCTRGSNLQNTRLKLDNLVRDTGKEYFAMHLLTREMVFPIGLSKIASERVTKRIFQIAYTDRLRLLRGELLRNLGYAVISAMGNEAAKSLLTTLRQDDLSIALFIIGHAAPAVTRKAMVDWLKENYPGARILALNPPHEEVPNADYNVLQNGPETWMPFVTSTMNAAQR